MVLNLKLFSANYKLNSTNYKVNGASHDGKNHRATASFFCRGVPWAPAALPRASPYGFPLHRQGDGDGRAFVFFAVQGNGTVMLFDDVLDDGQAQARPLDLAGTAGIGPVKAFKDALLFIFRDADARVADDEEGLVVVVADIDVDMAARPVVLDGIIEKVHDHFPKQAAVRPYFRIVHGTVDSDFLFHQDRFHEFYDILNQTAEAQPFGMDLALAVFDAGQVHDFFDHLQEAQGFLADECAEMDDIVFILENARRQDFGKAAD